MLSQSTDEGQIDLDMYQCEKVHDPKNLDDCGESQYGYCCIYEIKTKGKEPFKACLTSPFPEYFGGKLGPDEESAFQSHEITEEIFALAKRTGYVMDYAYVKCPKKDYKNGEKAVRCGEDYFSTEQGTCRLKSEGEDL